MVPVLGFDQICHLWLRSVVRLSQKQRIPWKTEACNGKDSDLHDLNANHSENLIPRKLLFDNLVPNSGVFERRQSGLFVCHNHQKSAFENTKLTSRERPKSAPYLRLKIFKEQQLKTLEIFLLPNFFTSIFT